MKLRRKIMLAIILLVFIPVTTMGVISYLYFSEAMERKTNDFYLVSLQEVNRTLRYALSEINTISDLSITQPLVQLILKRGSTRVTDNEIQELNNLFLTHPKIMSVHIYSQDELIYESGSSLELSLADLKMQSWFESTKSLIGRPLWLGPLENPNLISNPMYLTHSRTIMDYYSLEDIGTLVTTIKTELLEQVFWEASTLNQGDILLVNQQGTVIFSKSGESIGQDIPFPFLQNTGHKQSYIDNYNDTETFVTYLPTDNEGWFLVALTSLSDLRAESNRIRNIALGLLLFSLCTALLFDLFFVRKLVKAISSVVSGMKRVEKGSFIQIPSKIEKSNNESGLMLQGFNRMSSQIKDLLQRVQFEQQNKKQAEMQALVAQINPHFIYNSLESINSMAVLQGNKQISKMVISLGKLLRISISQDQELIPISMELEHVKHYLLIQKTRFEDKFDYIINLSEEAKHLYSLKLIVQPLVENALYHGIEPMKGKGFISIRAWTFESSLIIEITDNGLGFDAHSLLNIDQPGSTQENKYNSSGVGLMNVNERIRISFDTPYGIMVCSSANEGTTIRIRIPKLTSPTFDTFKTNPDNETTGGN